jgi:hypothetical protein
VLCNLVHLTMGPLVGARHAWYFEIYCLLLLLLLLFLDVTAWLFDQFLLGNKLFIY